MPPSRAHRLEVIIQIQTTSMRNSCHMATEKFKEIHLIMQLAHPVL